MSILIPCYNEAPTIEAVLRKVFAASVEKEVLVIDDGSADGTRDILDRLKSELGFQCILQERHRGKGAAIRAGLEQAQGEYVLIQDADLEYDPHDYPSLLKPLMEGRTDVVYGSRFLGPHRATYFWHRLGNWVITMLINLLFNASLTDVETGYKLFRRAVVEPLPLRALGFEFEVELTCKLLKRGQTIFEVPISFYGRSYEEGKKATWKDGMCALWVILCCRLNPWY